MNLKEFDNEIHNWGLTVGFFTGMMGRETGGGMVTDIERIEEWAPEKMRPGNMFVLDNAGEVLDKNDPSDTFWAVLACPECGTTGLVTRKQVAGLSPVICGARGCSAFFRIKDTCIVPLRPM